MSSSSDWKGVPVKELLHKRLDFGSSAKVAALAKQSADGALSSFAGLFGTRELTEAEKAALGAILEKFGIESTPDERARDLSALSAITSEIKAITNQAALLHGERIVRAQQILKKYAEGAFSAWLVSSYGNRQTPYNLLLYYQFYHAAPESMRPKIESMPRQAISVLASREAPFEKKQEVISAYAGETKSEILALIRKKFPLQAQDMRKKRQAPLLLARLEALFQQTMEELEEFRPHELKTLQGLVKGFLTEITER